MYRWGVKKRALAIPCTTWTQATNVLIFKQGSITIYASPQTVVSDTEIKGYFYFYLTHPTGQYDVRVENWSDGTEVVLEDGFTLNDENSQSISSVVPDTAHQVEAVTVTITGENTNFTQGSSVLKLSNTSTIIYPEDQTIISDTVIEGDFIFNPDYPADVYDVIVSTSSGSVVLEDGFELLPALILPDITDVDPESAEQDETVILTITGQDTHFDDSEVTNTVKLDNGNLIIYSQSVSVISPTLLEATFSFTYYHDTSTYDLIVYNELDGTMILPEIFELEPGPDQPIIVSVVPDTGQQVQQLLVTVTGENTFFTQGSSALVLRSGTADIFPENQYIINDTIIEGDFYFNPDYPVGDYDVNVFSSSAPSPVLPDGFYLLQAESLPGLISIIPDTSSQGQTVTLQITAENTHFSYPDLETAVKLQAANNTIYANSVTVIDSLVIDAEFSFYYSHLPDIYDLKVYNPLDGTMILENAFTLFSGSGEPQIISVDPDQANKGDTLWVTITGEGTSFTTASATIKFVQGSSTIHPDSHSIENDTLISGEFYFELDYPSGYYDVFVYDQYGSWSVSLNDGFYLFPPVSIELLDDLLPVHIYPNPTADFLIIERQSIGNLNISVEILNISGGIVYSNEISEKQLTHKINVSSFSSGVYFIRLRSENNKFLKKIVIH